MDEKKVKKNIGFYNLRITKLFTTDDVNLEVKKFLDVLDYVENLNNQDRLYDIDSSGRKKFHFIKEIYHDHNKIRLIFSSAKYEYRPPIIDKKTLVTSENPRTMTQGDEELTHVILLTDKTPIQMLIEEHRSGISPQTIVDYFNDFKFNYINKQKTKWEKLSSEDRKKTEEPKKNYRFTLTFDTNADFLGLLHSAAKIKLGRIYAQKQILGSEFMNYSNRLKSYAQPVELVLKNDTRLRDILKDIHKKFSLGENMINRIKVECTDNSGLPRIIDTDKLKKRESIEVSVSIIDGTASSDDIFEEMESLL